jgi:hypothetical protein
MRVVQTTRGVIARDRLQYAVILAFGPTALVVTTEWRVTSEGPDGPVVKRDSQELTYADSGALAQASADGAGPVVYTNRGLIPLKDLRVTVGADEVENALFVGVEWRVREEGIDAPHVRRDGQALMLSTPEVFAQFGSFSGELPVPSASNDVTIGLRGAQASVEQESIG